MSNRNPKDPYERFNQGWQEWLSAPISPDAQELRQTLPARLPARRARRWFLYSTAAVAATLVLAVGALLLLRPPAPESREQSVSPPSKVVHTVDSNAVLLVTESGDAIYVVLEKSTKNSVQEGR